MSLEETGNQPPELNSDHLESAPRPKKVLSPLQIEYASFFRTRLNSYGVTSPAKLGHPQKSEFFIGIKRDWAKTFCIQSMAVHFQLPLNAIQRINGMRVNPSTEGSSRLLDLFVDTVDSMQGQERDYIIYSMSNSNPLESMRRLEFFYSPNRLNVAITRAIKKCFVIANHKIFDIRDEVLREHKEYESVKGSLDTFKRYYALSTKYEIIEAVNEEW